MTNELSKREREIMEIIYKKKQCSAQEIENELNDGTSNSTIRTMLSILENKGFLSHHEEGRKFIYVPTMSTKKAGKSELKNAIKTFFNNSSILAIAAIVEYEKLSPNDIAQIEALIEKAKKDNQHE